MSAPARPCQRPRRSGRPGLRLAWLTLLLLLAGARAAAAQPTTAEATEESCLRDSECLVHYQGARQLSKAGRSEAALDEYQKAYQRLPVPRLLYSIARLQHRLGQSRAALSSYERFLTTTLADDEELRAKAREYKAQLLASPLPPEPAAVAEGEHAQAQSSAALPLAGAAQTRQPVYKKWWLWTLVGAAAAGAITAAVVATYPREPTIPAGAQSYAPMF